MEVALGLLALAAVVCAVSALGRKFDVSVPLLLVLAGVAGSFLPFVPRVDLNPELVLVGLLPPLLYAAALQTSLYDFRSNRRAIGLLSVGYVIFGTIVVGLVVWWLFPEIPLAAAIALAAVVAPPDAVAATAIARKVGMPRRIVSILEGESLVNDATALVCLRAAVAALAGAVSVAGDRRRLPAGRRRRAGGGTGRSLRPHPAAPADPQRCHQYHDVADGTLRGLPAGGGNPRLGRPGRGGHRPDHGHQGTLHAQRGRPAEPAEQLGDGAVPAGKLGVPPHRSAGTDRHRGRPGRLPGRRAESGRAAR